MATLEEIAAPVPNAIVDGPFGSNLKLSDYVDEGVPVLQGKNITDDAFQWFDIRFISKTKATELKRSSVKIGDILVVKIGSIGYSAVIHDLHGFDFAIIPANLAKITPNQGTVDTKYLHKWLTSVEAKRYLEGAASKTAQPALSLGKIKALPVPLPPLDEQRRIAEVLDRVQALQTKRRTALAQLDTLTQSIFLDLFGDPVINPKGWAIADFPSIVYFQEGPGIRNWQFRKEGVKLINVRNIVHGSLRPENTNRFLDRSEVEERYRHFLLDAGDLVMASSGVTWGKVARVEESHIPLCLNTSMIRLRPLNDRTNTVFIRSFVESSAFRNQIMRLITGSAQPNFGPAHLKRVRVPLPPIELQNEFRARVTKLEQVRESHRRADFVQQALVETLQHRAFRGEL